MVTVARADANQWEFVKQARLSALADAPQAFGSSLAREQEFDEQEWRKRVSINAWFLAWSNDRVVGVVAGIVEEKLPAERQLVAMWVESEERGRGVATALVNAVCAWAADCGALRMNLWVADGNPIAHQLYERLGFRFTGERQPLPSASHIGQRRMSRTFIVPRAHPLDDVVGADDAVGVRPNM